MLDDAAHTGQPETVGQHGADHTPCALHLQGASLVEGPHGRPRLNLYGAHDSTCAGAEFDRAFNRQSLWCGVHLQFISGNGTWVESPVRSALVNNEDFGQGAEFQSSRAFSVQCDAATAGLIMHTHQSDLHRAKAVIGWRGHAHYHTPLALNRVGAQRVRICTKTYGHGGRIGDDAFLGWWMERWRALAVTEVIMYVLDLSVPPSLRRFTARPSASAPPLELRKWPPSRPYTDKEYQWQSMKASSEIEVHYRTAMAHCVSEAVGRAEWVMVLDTDEVLALGPRSAGTTISSSVIGAQPPPGQVRTREPMQSLPHPMLLTAPCCGSYHAAYR